MVRHKVVAGVAALTLGGLTACGNDTPSTPPPQTVTVTQQSTTSSSGEPSSTPTAAATPERPESIRNDATARCSAATLSGEITASDAGAGNRYAKLVVTNTSKAPCTLYGYGGLQLIDAAGRSAPTNLSRRPDPGPALVTLQPGQQAFKNLHWGAVPDGSEPTTGPCEPESTGATVIPPDETQPFTIRYNFGSVCQHGAIDGSAYYR
jgi:Protein of unknown function (DUF4232)